jgi:hypothetical protein
MAEHSAPSPIVLAAFETAADEDHEAEQPRPVDNSDSARCRRCLRTFVDEAQKTVAMLDRHARMKAYDQQLARLKEIIDHAQAFDADEHCADATAQANLLWLQFKVARAQLRECEELAGARSPGMVKLLRDLERSCRLTASELQRELASLRREIDAP